MKLCTLFSVLSASLMVAGCATASDQSAAANNASSGAATLYVPATNADTQKVVTQYVPVAVPGQLMPVPNNTAPTPAFKTAADAVDYANQQATQVPNTTQFFNSMMTYDYTPGSLYTVYAAPMKITDIALQPGEKLVSEAAGDTLRWQIAQTYSGSGDNITQHILVKPNQAGLQNTMLITTDQHVYHLVLQSTDQSYMASVQWNYPGDLVNYSSNSQNPAINPAAADSSPSVDLSNLDFGYHMFLLDGQTSIPAWYPTRVFNDGKRTFIQLPPNYSSSQLPVLYVADENGNYASMINWRYRAPYIVVDVVIQKARLQSGVESTGQTVVEVDHN